MNILNVFLEGCIEGCDEDGVIRTVFSGPTCWLPPMELHCPATCSADIDSDFSCDSTPDKLEQYRYLGCWQAVGWVRPYGDVETTVDGVLSCQESCHEGGYDYFGLECSMETMVNVFEEIYEIALFFDRVNY